MTEIRRLATQFRDALDMARNSGVFNKDLSFSNFPYGCCGDTSVLLSQYLLENDIQTYYVCGTYRDDSYENIQSHAWLLINNHTIIDITGDQFKYSPEFLNYDRTVYVGVIDEFHRLFEVQCMDIYENKGLSTFSDLRLNELYRKIMKYISH